MTQEKPTPEQYMKALGVLEDILSNSQDEENRPIFGDWKTKVVEAYDYLDFQDIEDVNLMLSLSIDHEKDSFVREVVKASYPKVSSDIRFRLCHLISYYDHYESHIEEVFVPYVGSICSSDVSGWLISQYKNYVLTNEIPEKFKQGFWTPKAGTLEEWFAYMKLIPNMLMGKKFNEYVEKRNVLESQFKDVK